MYAFFLINIPPKCVGSVVVKYKIINFKVNNAHDFGYSLKSNLRNFIIFLLKFNFTLALRDRKISPANSALSVIHIRQSRRNCLHFAPLNI